MNQPALLLEQASKAYRLSRDQSLISRLTRSLRVTSPPVLRWAVSPLDLRVERGSTLGIIGDNGAGKTTLLRLLAGIIPLTAGRRETHGHLLAFMGITSGIHPHLNGWDNLTLKASSLGLKNGEIRSRQAAMAEFSGLGPLLNEPVREYSTGMVVRLAFAVYLFTDFDILLVDEAISGGDALFQERCLDRLLAFRRAGKTICLVSHGLDLVEKFCVQALWLHSGRISASGDCAQILADYRNHLGHHLPSPPGERS